MKVFVSKHLGSVHVHTQFVKSRNEWVGYAVSNGQFLWSTQGSYDSSHAASNATVAQIEQHYDTILEVVK